MADENKFLYLGNNRDKISYDKFKGKLEKKDIATNNKLLQIFNFFDKDGNGIIETANSKGVNEMQSLWNTIKTSANENNNSIFENSEAEELLANLVDSTGKSLADNQITASDLFGFLNLSVNKPSKEPFETIQTQKNSEYTEEEKKIETLDTLWGIVNEANEIFYYQKYQQGAISDMVDGIKETFDLEYASSRVNRYLMNEESSASLLQLSHEGKLTVKDYLEAKINLAISLLTGLREDELSVKKKEIESLESALKNLTPEKLTLLIKKITSLSDEEYKETAPKVVEKLINQTKQKKEIDDKPHHIENQGGKIINPTVTCSIDDINTTDAYRVMEFEETFFEERGVEYNYELIKDYIVKEEQLDLLTRMHNKNEEIKNILHQATVTVDGNNKYGAPQHDAIETCNQNLMNALDTAFKKLYKENSDEAQKVINEIVGENSGINVIKDEKGNLIGLDFYGSNKKDKLNVPINPYNLVLLSNGLQKKLEDNYKKVLNGKNLDEYSEEVKSAYQMAYGAKNAQDMANAFAQSQQEGVQNTKAVVQGLGMVVMVAGQLIPVGGQAATALIVAKGAITYGGMLTSTLGSVGVSAVENYNKAGGPTEEDKKAMLQELGTSLALVGSGMGIGKSSEAIFKALVMKNCPRLIAFTTEVGVDATASLLADYAITGQIDLSAEGIAQLQNILVGIVRAKGGRNYLNTHAGDICTETKSTKTESAGNVKPEETKVTPKDKSVGNKEIHIPPGVFRAPNEKFSETDDGFRNIVRNRAKDIIELDKIKDNGEFLKRSFQIITEEMGLADSPIKFEITDSYNQYDLVTNTVSINPNWANGDRAELFGAIAHELNHFLQWKEVLLNYDQDSDYWVKVVNTLRKSDNGPANIEYIVKKYPDNLELQEFFNKAKSYEDNWQNYIDPVDPKTGKVDVTSEQYKRYKEQSVEAEAMRRGNIVVEEYRRAVNGNNSPSSTIADKSGLDQRALTENFTVDEIKEMFDAAGENAKLLPELVNTPAYRSVKSSEIIKLFSDEKKELINEIFLLANIKDNSGSYSLNKNDIEYLAPIIKKYPNAINIVKMSKDGGKEFAFTSEQIGKLAPYYDRGADNIIQASGFYRDFAELYYVVTKNVGHYDEYLALKKANVRQFDSEGATILAPEYKDHKETINNLSSITMAPKNSGFYSRSIVRLTPDEIKKLIPYYEKNQGVITKLLQNIDMDHSSSEKSRFTVNEIIEMFDAAGENVKLLPELVNTPAYRSVKSSEIIKLFSDEKKELINEIFLLANIKDNSGSYSLNKNDIEYLAPIIKKYPNAINIVKKLKEGGKEFAFTSEQIGKLAPYYDKGADNIIQASGFYRDFAELYYVVTKNVGHYDEYLALKKANVRQFDSEGATILAPEYKDHKETINNLSSITMAPKNSGFYSRSIVRLTPDEIKKLIPYYEKNQDVITKLLQNIDMAPSSSEKSRFTVNEIIEIFDAAGENVKLLPELVNTPAYRSVKSSEIIKKIKENFKNLH